MISIIRPAFTLRSTDELYNSISLTRLDQRLYRTWIYPSSYKCQPVQNGRNTHAQEKLLNKIKVVQNLSSVHIFPIEWHNSTFYNDYITGVFYCLKKTWKVSEVRERERLFLQQSSSYVNPSQGDPLSYKLFIFHW